MRTCMHDACDRFFHETILFFFFFLQETVSLPLNRGNRQEIDTYSSFICIGGSEGGRDSGNTWKLKTIGDRNGTNAIIVRGKGKTEGQKVRGEDE